MAFDPLPLNLVGAEGLVETLPEVDILHRFFIRGFPAAFFPVMDPAGNSLTHILAVGTEHHIAGLRQRFKRNNGRHQFHPVIGGEAIARAEGFLMLAIT